MNNSCALHKENSISAQAPFHIVKIHNARRAENFSGSEQYSSRIRVPEQNFEQKKR